MSARRSTRTAGREASERTASEDEMVQLSDLALAVKGHAYEHGIQGREKYTRIVAYETPSSTTYVQWLKNLRKEETGVSSRR